MKGHNVDFDRHIVTKKESLPLFLKIIIIGPILCALVIGTAYLGAELGFMASRKKAACTNNEIEYQTVLLEAPKVSFDYDEEEAYDQTEDISDEEEIKDEKSDTILGETDDAGEDYIKETLFIGDSNTVRMSNYNYVSLDNSLAVVGMGIQSVKDLKCIKFSGRDAVTMVEAVKLMQPKRIIITFGTNNAGAMATDKFIDTYKKALEAINDAYPYVDIIVNSVPPFNKTNSYPKLKMADIDDYNDALIKMCEEEGYKFLNTSEVLKDEASGYAVNDFTVSDGIHISKLGLETMFNYIRTHAKETEDIRPKPLKDIPTQVKTNYAINNGKMKEDPSAAGDMSDIGYIFSVNPETGEIVIVNTKGETVTAEDYIKQTTSNKTGNGEAGSQDNGNSKGGAHVHSFGSYTSNGDSHVRTCTICGASESGAHSLAGGDFTIAPTEDSAGERMYYCSECDYKQYETVPPRQE